MAFRFLLVCAPLLRSPPERRNRNKVQLDRPKRLLRQRNQTVAAQLNRSLKPADSKDFLIAGSIRWLSGQPESREPRIWSQHLHNLACQGAERQLNARAGTTIPRGGFRRTER